MKTYLYTLIGTLCFAAPFASTNAAPDINGYEAQYECRAGNPNCDVDVVALGNRQCDQTITPSMPWSSIDWGRNTICIEAGDHVSKGSLEIPASASGAIGQYKVLRYTRTSDSGDEPWSQSSTNRAVLYAVDIKASNIVLHRLTISPNYANRNGVTVAAGGSVQGVILDRLLIEKNRGWLILVGSNATASNLTVQNSVIRDTTVLGGSGDRPCIGIEWNASDAHFVNNEISNCSDKILVSNYSSAEGLVIENNDLYISSDWYTDGTGRLDPNGDHACSENGIDLKGGGSSGRLVRILHNRLWGERYWDSSCADGASGEEIVLHDGGSGSDYHLVHNNIIFDAQYGVSFPNPMTYQNSIIGNIFWKIGAYANQATAATVLTYKTSGTEWYLNSFVDNERWGALEGTGNGDFRCNALIANGSYSGSSLGSGTDVTRNVWYGTPKYATQANDIERALVTRANANSYSVGDVLRVADVTNCVSGSESACFLYRVIQAGVTASMPPVYCTVLGCTTTDGAVVAQAIRGPHVFYRKLLTNPEPYAIPYVTVHASADEVNICPPSFADRPGIGINDDTAWNGLFVKDLKGASRTGTPGALETSAGSGGGSGGTGSGPYGGTPWSIPGTIQAEDFDNGGEGVAYHDVDPGNNGGVYRSTDVDIETIPNTTAQFDVGWGKAGEWLNYTVNVTAAGTYTLEVAVGAVGTGGTFHVEFNGENKTGTLAIPDTGDWQNYALVTSTVTLTAGQQTLRVALDTNGTTGYAATIDFLRLTATGANGSTPYYGTPIALPSTVQAEDFDNGGEGVAYHDLDIGNNGGAYRPTADVDIEAIPNASNEYNVGWGKAGEWLQYTVNVPTAGTYTIEVNMGQVQSGAAFHIEFNGQNKTGTLAVPNTGDWQAFGTVATTANLVAGTQVMRLVLDSNTASGYAATIDWIRMTAGTVGSGMLAHWPLDDGSGPVAVDTTGDGHDGILTNGPLWNANGRFGGALALDGIDDYVSVGAPVMGDRVAFALSAWVKITAIQKGVPL